MKKSKLNRPHPSNVTSNPLIKAHNQLLEIEKNKKAGNLRKALIQCQALLKKYPDYVGALHNVGLIYFAMGNTKLAAQNLAYAAALDPNNFKIQLNLAYVYQKIEAHEEATRILEFVVSQAPLEIEPLVALGTQLNNNSKYDRAETIFKKALILEPTNYLARVGLAKIKLELGLPKEAATALLECVKSKQTTMSTVRALSQIPSNLVPIDLIKLLTKIDNNSSDKSLDYKIEHGITKASILINMEEFKDGFELLHSTNELQFKKMQSEYKISKSARHKFWEASGKLHKITSGPKVSAQHLQSIHIFGPSRSGKSTLERLLGTLPEVQCGFESSLIRSATQKTSMRTGLLTLNNAYQLPLSTDGIFRDFYNKELVVLAEGKSFFTCTTPGRIYDVHHLVRVVQNTKIVFVKRDIDDTVYRIYRTRYRKSHAHSYNLDATREYVTWYHSMQDRFAELLPNRTMTINYEDMVADPLKIADNVRQFCGISTEFGTLPDIGDDRGSSKEFKEFLV